MIDSVKSSSLLFIFNIFKFSSAIVFDLYTPLEEGFLIISSIVLSSILIFDKLLEAYIIMYNNY